MLLFVVEGRELDLVRRAELLEPVVVLLRGREAHRGRSGVRGRGAAVVVVWSGCGCCGTLRPLARRCRQRTRAHGLEPVGRGARSSGLRWLAGPRAALGRKFQNP